MGDCLKQPLFNAQTRGAIQVAPLLDKGIASSFVHILPYVYLASPLIFFYFTTIVYQSKPVTLRTLPCHLALVKTVIFQELVNFT